MKKLLLDSSAICFFAFCPLALSAQTLMEVYNLQSGDTLNVRSGPGTSYADIGDLYAGQPIQVFGYDATGKWAQIYFDGQAAFVSKSFLQLGSGESGGGIFFPHKVVGIKAGDPDGGLVVRSGAGKTFTRLDVIGNGTQVNVINISPDNKWAEVTYGGQQGWVSYSYLDKLTNDNSSPSQPSPEPEPIPAGDTSIGPDGEGLPAIYSVSNILAHDVLWVRDKPSPLGNPLANFALNEPIVVLGMATSNWARVAIGQSVSYVNVAYLNRGGGTQTASGMQTGIGCRGTEPFWSLSIAADSSVIFSEPNSILLASTLQFANPSGTSVAFGAAPIAGTISPNLCNDGMSDTQYPWSASITAPSASGGNVTLNGCCTLN